MTGLVRRAITAFIFVGVMIGGLLGGRYTFLLLFFLITALSLWELLGIVLPDKQTNKNLARKLLGMLIGLSPFVLASFFKLNLFRSIEVFTSVSVIVVLPLLFMAFLYELFTKSADPFRNIAFMALTFVYIGIPFALLPFISINDDQYSASVVLGMLMLTWANDSGAYLIGSQFGKTKLFPRISPKKTWEGSLGGVVMCLILALIISRWFTELNTTQWLVMGGIVAIFGSLGDLVESMLKRSFEIKDSGNLLPGHGGFLDRFDAFIFLIPFAMAYLLLIR